jgi:two-component system chemotaxis response regulator CheY
MSKKVVLVGHCGPDNSYLRMSVGSVDRSLKVVSADDLEELYAHLKDGADLLLLNRELGYGFDDSMGIDLIRSLRPKHPDLKMMLVSNYPDAQAAAVAAGAVPGFGKRELGSTRVAQLLRDTLATVHSTSTATPAAAQA